MWICTPAWPTEDRKPARDTFISRGLTKASNRKPIFQPNPKFINPPQLNCKQKSWRGKTIGKIFINYKIRGKETFLAKRSRKRDIPQPTELKPRQSAQRVVAAVCEEFDCTTDLILQKGRKKNMLHDVAIYLSREFTGDSGVNLGKYFGNISGAGITFRYNHLAGQIQSNHKLRRRIKRIRSKIINN